jgi:hypothetical protein
MKSTEEALESNGRDIDRMRFSDDFLVKETDDYGSLDQELEDGIIYIADSYSGNPRYFLVATEQTIRDLYQKYIYSNHNVIIYDFYK